MVIKRIRFDEPTIVVLGAGATRGASFVSELAGTQPPLDADFFTQVQRLSGSKPRKLVANLIENVVTIFGTNFELTMEEFFTQVEHLSNVFVDYRGAGRPRKNPYPEIRQQLLQVLAAVLDEAVGREAGCKYHERLVDSMGADDTILSFNYDWLIDSTLRKKGQGKWNPRVGYGVDAYRNGKAGAGTRYWACGLRDYPAESIRLLKLHGSMNWFPVAREASRLRLRLRQRWWHQKGDLKFEIAPPEWNKPIRSGIYQHVWRRAREALRRTKAICFIGYSLPPTDLPAQALLRVDSGITDGGASTLKLLVIVNPDRVARSRIRSVLSQRIDKSTRVLTFELFRDFAEFLKDPAVGQ